MAGFVRDIWHKYHLWYFKIVSNFTHLMAREISYNNFEISLVVFMPNITTNHAITYTNHTSLLKTLKYHCFHWHCVFIEKLSTQLACSRLVTNVMTLRPFFWNCGSLVLAKSRISLDLRLRSEALLKFDGYNDVQITTLFLN